jgi:hypothetical protein
MSGLKEKADIRGSMALLHETAYIGATVQIEKG